MFETRVKEFKTGVLLLIHFCDQSDITIVWNTKETVAMGIPHTMSNAPFTWHDLKSYNTNLPKGGFEQGYLGPLAGMSYWDSLTCLNLQVCKN